MPLLPAKQMTDLGTWSFVYDYKAHHADLVDVARVVYKTLESAAAGGTAPTEAECEDPLKISLQGVTVFTRILHSKHHLLPALYDYYAEGMARLLLDNAWADIIR